MTADRTQNKASTSRLQTVVASVGRLTNRQCRVGLILGSGLGEIADDIADPVDILYAEIEEFPTTTAPGHQGRLVLGDLFGCPVAALQGRFHLYEGWSAADIALSVQLLRHLGAETVIVTNAAGALNADFSPGEMMLINDHLNFTGCNPLIGLNDDSIGPRFPDMSRAYDPDLYKLTRSLLDENDVAYREGVYAAVTGPSLETSAERRFFRAAGADAIGMSTVIEVIAAVHSGCRVIGITAITNMATGAADQAADSIEDIHKNAAIAGKNMRRTLQLVLPEIMRSTAATP